MRFFKIICILFSISVILRNSYASEPQETMVFSKPQEYYVYAEAEGDNAKKIKVDKETLDLFDSLKNMFESIPYSREENFNQPIQISLNCSEQALEKIFDTLLPLRGGRFGFKEALNKLSLDELVDTINCIDILGLQDTSQKLDATGNLIPQSENVNVKDFCLSALADKIVDIASQFQQYIMHQDFYKTLPNYNQLRDLNTDINLLLEKYYEMKQTFWNRLKIVAYYLSGNPDHLLQVWQSKKIIAVFDDISDKLRKKPNPEKEINEKKDETFNYKVFLFAALLAAISSGKTLWDLYKNRFKSE